jgi:hypothetical protein
MVSGSTAGREHVRVPLQIAVHDCEEDLQKQVHGVYQNGEQVEPRLARHGCGNEQKRAGSAALCVRRDGVVGGCGGAEVVRCGWLVTREKEGGRAGKGARGRRGNAACGRAGRIGGLGMGCRAGRDGRWEE